MIIRPPEFQSKRMPNEARDGTIDPKHVVTEAANQPLAQVMVIGIKEDGYLFAAGSHAHVADNLLLIDRIRQHIMAQFQDDSF